MYNTVIVVILVYPCLYTAYSPGPIIVVLYLTSHMDSYPHHESLIIIDAYGREINSESPYSPPLPCFLTFCIFCIVICFFTHFKNDRTKIEHRVSRREEGGGVRFLQRVPTSHQAHDPPINRRRDPILERRYTVQFFLGIVSMLMIESYLLLAPLLPCR